MVKGRTGGRQEDHFPLAAFIPGITGSGFQRGFKVPAAFIGQYTVELAAIVRDVGGDAARVALIALPAVLVAYATLQWLIEWVVRTEPASDRPHESADVNDGKPPANSAGKRNKKRV